MEDSESLFEVIQFMESKDILIVKIGGHSAADLRARDLLPRFTVDSTRVIKIPEVKKITGGLTEFNWKYANIHSWI